VQSIKKSCKERGGKREEERIILQMHTKLKDFQTFVTWFAAFQVAKNLACTGILYQKLLKKCSGSISFKLISKTVATPFFVVRTIYGQWSYSWTICGGSILTFSLF
jgi:hypothetical protein